jgi:histidinol phosphatase-like enzyme
VKAPAFFNLPRGINMDYKNKSIVLDLDGVIADIDTGISDYLDYVWGVDVDYKDWLMTDTQDEEALKLFSNALFWKNLKPFEDAFFQVNYWFNLGIDVHVVTARRRPAAYFSKFGEKVDIIKGLNPMFVVEDNPSEIEILEDAGIKCFLKNAWYNAGYWKQMDRVNSLLDIDLENM